MSRIREIEMGLQVLAYAGHSRSGVCEEEAEYQRDAWAAQAPEDTEFLLQVVEALTEQMRVAAAALRALAVPAAREAADRLDGAATYAHLSRDMSDLARLGGPGPWYPNCAPVTYIPTIDAPDGGDAA